MPYKITIEEITQKTVTEKGEWCVVEKRLRTKDEWEEIEKFIAESQRAKIGDIQQEVYGYAPDRTVTRETQRTIYEQRVETLDIKDVIASVNRMAWHGL